MYLCVCVCVYMSAYVCVVVCQQLLTFYLVLFLYFLTIALSHLRIPLRALFFLIVHICISFSFPDSLSLSFFLSLSLLTKSFSQSFSPPPPPLISTCIALWSCLVALLLSLLESSEFLSCLLSMIITHFFDTPYSSIVTCDNLKQVNSDRNRWKEVLLLT